MKQQTKNPSIGQEFGALAGLYRTVFWMMGRRLRDGPNWEDRLREETLRVHHQPPFRNPSSQQHG